MYVQFRESHFGTLSSMTRFRTHLDDMPAAGLCVLLLRVRPSIAGLMVYCCKRLVCSGAALRGGHCMACVYSVFILGINRSRDRRWLHRPTPHMVYTPNASRRRVLAQLTRGAGDVPLHVWSKGLNQRGLLFAPCFSAGYAYSAAATNRTQAFNSLLFGHIANYQSRGSFNAPEQLG